MHAPQLSAIGRGGVATGGIRGQGSLVPRQMLGPRVMLAPEKRAMHAPHAPQRRICVRRHGDRKAQVSRGGFLPSNPEQEDENSFISGDGSAVVSAAYAPDRQNGGSSSRRNSNSIQGESELGNAPPNPLGSRRVTEESGCGTTTNSSATLGHMSVYRGPMGTLSAPESVARGSGGESDTCTGAQTYTLCYTLRNP